MSSRSSSRRVFLGAAAATVAAACSKKQPMVGNEPPAGPLPGAPKEGEIEPPQHAAMPKRRLGKTGVEVSLLGLGGYHIGVQKDEAESIRIIRRALDAGVTFLDNCWDYNEGKSEERMGKALRDGYRAKAFVMTKLDGRTKQSAGEQLEQSLKRLQVDAIDLVQIHENIRMTDAERVFSAGGAIEALMQAKKEGKLKYIGFTGHKDPAIHLHMIDVAASKGFTFDTVQMPINVMDAHYQSFEKRVIPVAQGKGMGVLGMKPLASGLILESKAVSARECLQYAMSRPVSVTITGCDSMGILEQALDVAYAMSKPPSDADVSALLAKTAPLSQDGKYEQFKTTERFDGTSKNPHWLEAAKI